MLGTCARGACAQCASLFLISKTAGRNALKFGCVARGPVAMRFTQDGKFCTNASVTVTHLSTFIRSRSFSAQKASYWYGIPIMYLTTDQHFLVKECSIILIIAESPFSLKADTSFILANCARASSMSKNPRRIIVLLRR